jgi:DNA replication protein DnaC
MANPNGKTPTAGLPPGTPMQVIGQLEASLSSPAATTGPTRTGRRAPAPLAPVEGAGFWVATPEELAALPTAAEYAEEVAASPCACGGSGYVLADDLPVNHPAHGMYFPCACLPATRQQRLQQRLARLFADAGIPPEFRGLSLADFEALPKAWRAGKRGVYEMARQFADVARYETQGGLVETYRRGGQDYESTRAGAVFYGPVGTCKSGLAAAVAQAWIAAGKSTLWIDYLDLVKAVQSGYGQSDGFSEARVKAAQEADLLVLDDLGRKGSARQASEDRNEIAYRILGGRHRARRPTLVTTNLAPGEIEAQFDPRIGSRLYQVCHFVRVDEGSPDVRRLQALGEEVS